MNMVVMNMVVMNMVVMNIVLQSSFSELTGRVQWWILAVS